MAQKWVAALLACLMAIAACGSNEPAANPSSVSVPFPVMPPPSNSKTKIDDQEVKNTKCDIPSKNVVRATNSYGGYGARLEVQRSDLRSCDRFYWLQLTPISLPPGEAAKDFAAVLRVSNRDEDAPRDIAVLRAQLSNLNAPLVTTGRVLLKGQHVQGCLVLLNKDRTLRSQDSTCTTPYLVP